MKRDCQEPQDAADRRRRLADRRRRKFLRGSAKQGADPNRYSQPQDLAQRYGVSINKVLAWIADGSLVAIDVSRRRGQRPRWRISPDAVAAFEAARSSSASAPPTQPPRRRRRDARVIEFF